MRPGDPISLTISKGKEQIAVPDVVGQLWSDAKKALTEAGFSIKFKNDGVSQLISDFPFARVKAINPGAGTTVDKGSTITVTLGAN